MKLLCYLITLFLIFSCGNKVISYQHQFENGQYSIIQFELRQKRFKEKIQAAAIENTDINVKFRVKKGNIIVEKSEVEQSEYEKELEYYISGFYREYDIKQDTFIIQNRIYKRK